jgi:hypothetical protein
VLRQECTVAIDDSASNWTLETSPRPGINVVRSARGAALLSCEGKSPRRLTTRMDQPLPLPVPATTTSVVAYRPLGRTSARHRRARVSTGVAQDACLGAPLVSVGPGRLPPRSVAGVANARGRESRPSSMPIAGWFRVGAVAQRSVAIGLEAQLNRTATARPSD